MLRFEEANGDNFKMKRGKGMVNRGLIVLVLAAFVAGGVFAQEDLGYEREYPAYVDDATQTYEERSRTVLAIGGGIMADATRSGESIDYRFWSQIYTGPWGFVDTRFFELSWGLAVGRMARRNRWCLLVLAANSSLLWKVPFGVLGIHPLLGVGFDAIVLVRYECLRSDRVVSEAIPDGRTFMNFSVLKFKIGFGRDFDFREDRFFRVRLVGYYGRRLGNPHPWGGTLRLGVGRRL